jgi:ATP-binding cassette subfamily F protein 2
MDSVVFSQLAMEHPHILLLDEPTNHLDMTSIDALATAIKEFEGGAVIVSHDFRTSSQLLPFYRIVNFYHANLGLISQVAEELWEVKDKKIRNLSKVRAPGASCRSLSALDITSFPPLHPSQEGITIKDYKNILIKESQSAIEKAKLFSKSSKT